MSIDTRFTPAIRNALLEQMQDLSGRYTPEGGKRENDGNIQSNTPGTDSVSLSDAARQLHAAVSTLAGQEIFDVERVTELKFAIDSGIYRIDPERVADKFHRFNQDL